MEILEFQITTGFGGSAKIFGLCNDGNMYRWDYRTGAWKLYIKAPDEELDKIKEND